MENSNFFVFKKIITISFLMCFLAILVRLLILIALVFLVGLRIFSKIAIDNLKDYV